MFLRPRLQLEQTDPLVASLGTLGGDDERSSVTFGREGNLSLQHRPNRSDSSMPSIVGRFLLQSNTWWVENPPHPEGRIKPILYIHTGPDPESMEFRTQLAATARSAAARCFRIDEPYLEVVFRTEDHMWTLRGSLSDVTELTLPPRPDDERIRLTVSAFDLTDLERAACLELARPLLGGRTAPLPTNEQIASALGLTSTAVDSRLKSAYLKSTIAPQFLVPDDSRLYPKQWRETLARVLCDTGKVNTDLLRAHDATPGSP